MRRMLCHVLTNAPDAFWGTVIGSCIAVDVACSRNAIPGDTLSEVLRKHPYLFAAGWLALSAWLAEHIVVRALRERTQ